MPLSPPAKREPIHTRRIECHGYRRADGMWDLEGQLFDGKSYSFNNQFRGEVKAGEPVHHMWVRLTIDDDFVVREIEAATDASPYQICPDITPNFAVLKGVKIGKGWTKAVADRLGGVHGCTHIVELLGRLATVAYQTIYPLRAREAKAEQRPATVRPNFLDTCHALRSDGPVVKQHYPAHYKGS